MTAMKLFVGGYGMDPKFGLNKWALISKIEVTYTSIEFTLQQVIAKTTM